MSTAKTGTPVLAADQIGIFPANRKPCADRPGLYLRKSKKSGTLNWAYWDGNNWFKYSGSKAKALQKYRDRRMSKQHLPWVGCNKPTPSTAKPLQRI